MKKIKAIVSDFDGTLVDHRHTIDPKVISAIKDYLNKGNIFSIATGRAYAGTIEKTCNELNTSDLTIVRGGSEIISRKTREVVWGKYINPQILKNLLEYLQKNQVIYAAEYGEHVYTLDGLPNAGFGEGTEYKHIADLPQEGVPKIILLPSNGNTKILHLLESLTNIFPILHVVRFTYKNEIGIDINTGGAGKHMALLEYAKLMNINPAEILGVGDSYNDYPLLTACGVKVAMGNSPQELKDIADYVVNTQQENGILDVINLVSNSSNF